MSIKKISKKDFAELVDSLILSEKVFGVQAKGEKFDFGVLEKAENLRLDYDVTLQAPRKYFLPPEEVLMSFEVGVGNYETHFDSETFVLVGVHPYDVAAIGQMDVVFDSDNKDNHYFERRDNATIIACDVVTASKNVFASSMGTATIEKGFDVLLTDIGDDYAVEIGTPKGQDLMEKGKLVDADSDDVAKRDKVQEGNKKGLNKHKLNCAPSDLPKLLDGAYEHAVWEEKAETCFSCGSCNQVCPTCYCFNVFDEVEWDLKQGNRKRAWDGCLLDGFTKVAGDHEFRNKRSDRFRHRLYRKGKYVPGKLGGEID